VGNHPVWETRNDLGFWGWRIGLPMGPIARTTPEVGTVVLAKQ